jgi:hypothetical protein
MDKLDFYLDWYHKENDRQTSLNDSLNLPIGILTGLFAVIFFMLKEFSYGDELLTWDEVVFVLGMALALISWIVVAYNLFQSYNRLYKGYEFMGIPYPTTLNEQYKKIEDYHNTYKSQLSKDITADSLFEDQLTGMISEYLNNNISNNDQKSKYLHRSKQFLLICISAIIFSALPFFINYLENQKKASATKVEVTNFNDLNNSRNFDNKHFKPFHHGNR